MTCITGAVAHEPASADFLLIAGRAVFLVFSFVVAAISFTAWRRATRRQTAEVLSQTQIVLQRLAELEARVDATRAIVTPLGERLERPRGAGPSPTRPHPATRSRSAWRAAARAVRSSWRAVD